MHDIMHAGAGRGEAFLCIWGELRLCLYRNFTGCEIYALLGEAQCFTLQYETRLYDQEFCTFQVKGVCIIITDIGGNKVTFSV